MLWSTRANNGTPPDESHCEVLTNKNIPAKSCKCWAQVSASGLREMRRDSRMYGRFPSTVDAIAVAKILSLFGSCKVTEGVGGILSFGWGVLLVKAKSTRTCRTSHTSFVIFGLRGTGGMGDEFGLNSREN